MTADQVRADLGEPHEKIPPNRAEEGEFWVYYTSWTTTLCIQFDREGRVQGQWI